MTLTNFKVMILGGGNCGLALATGLMKAGIDYTVFERDSEDAFYHSPRDWGMLLHWGAEYLEKVLPPHLQARVKEPRCDPHLDTGTSVPPVPFVDAHTGETIIGIPIEGLNRVSRMKLRRFLMDGETLNVQFEKHADRISERGDSVEIAFRDGTIASGSMVIGCDGSRSKAREFLVGKEAAQLEPVDLTMINWFKTGYTPEEAHLLQTLHPVFKIAALPDRPGNGLLAALDIADSNDPASWKFQNYLGWWGPPYAKDLQDLEKRREFYLSIASSLCEPFRTALLRIDGEALPVYAGQQWAPTMQWDNCKGKITVAGDAAHSMVPQRGQGLNNAIKDAADLVDAIIAAVAEDIKLEKAIAEYEAEMKPRGAREVALSLEQALKARDHDTLKESPIFSLGWQRGQAAEESSDPGPAQMQTV